MAGLAPHPVPSLLMHQLLAHEGVPGMIVGEAALFASRTGSRRSSLSGGVHSNPIFVFRRFLVKTKNGAPKIRGGQETIVAVGRIVKGKEEIKGWGKLGRR